MKLESEFFRLPLRFDVERLVAEIGQFDESAWRPHPTDYQGNTALILISSKGGQNDDFLGPMQPTPVLERCPYIAQVLASFQTVFGRSRLMRLAPNSTVPEHSDINYHWYNRVRIHVPIVTFPEVRFYCNGRDVHMASGEAWIFDTWKLHRVENPTPHTRVHLVADTAGTPEFWNLVAHARRPFDPANDTDGEARFVPYVPGKRVELKMEKFTHHVIMAPGEVDALVADLVADLRATADNPRETCDRFITLVNDFRRRWRSIWSSYGTRRSEWFRFEELLRDIHTKLGAIGDPLHLASNGTIATQVLNARILSAAFYPAASEEPPVPSAASLSRKVGRNDPCPCGSGKKYKFCHG